MDTPESPTRSLQSPVEEKDLSGSELLDSPDDDEDRAISDSELLYEENGELAEEDEEEHGVEIGGGGLALQAVAGEEDEVVPDFVSEPEDEEPEEETGGLGQENEAILLMEGDDDDKDEDGDGQLGSELDGEDGLEDVDDQVLDTPQSPEEEPEQDKYFVTKENKDLSEAYGDYRRDAAELGADDDDDEEEEEVEGVKSIAEEEEKDVLRTREGRAAVSRDIKEDLPSVSRELDEHELDYDEEVPEEPNIPTLEDEEEEDAKALEEEVSEDTTVKKKEKKPILPPSPKDGESRKTDDSKIRRDSFRDRRKEDDDGEIDEGEIDDDDLEEGEVKDPSDRKIRPRPICRFFIKGNCTWGMNCRFIHPGVNDKGNYSLITKPDLFSPNGAQPGGPLPLIPNNSWAAPAVEELPPPPPPVEPPVESAWERGLRHAKEMLKKATIRKEQEPDFEEKRFNVTIGEDEREFDKENEFFRDRSYRLIREEMDIREPIYGDQYADPYHDYEMEALWRGGQYENFRVQYTEAPLPYHYNERERERDPRERHRDRERERDHRERERRQREREREREREKERMRRKEEWERDRIKRDEKERPKMRPPRDIREKKDDNKLKPESPLTLPPNRPMEHPTKKELVPLMRQPDEWKDPWRRSKSPRRRSGLGSPPRGRRRNRRSGSSVSLSHSSRSSSRSSSYTGSGSSHSQSRSTSLSSYSSHSSHRSSFSGSRSRSRSFSSSPSPTPALPKNAKNKPDLPPMLAKGMPLKQGAVPTPRRDKPPMKKAQTPPPPSGPMTRPFKPLPEGGKPPTNLRETGGIVVGAGGDVSAGTAGGGGVMVRQLPSREPGKPPNQREGRQKEREQHPPRRRTVSGSGSGSGSSYSGSSSRSRSSSNSLSHSRSGSRKSKKSRSLSVSSVSSVSSGSSSSSSVRSADSDDMYADLASPVSSASTRSPTPGHPRKERAVPPRDRPPQNRDKNRERLVKKDETLREDRRKMNPSGGPPRGGNPMPRPVPGSRGGHSAHHPAGNMPPPGNYGGSSSHKDIKLTLLNKQQGDKGNRKRYLPTDKDRPGSPLSKRMAMSPDRARDRRLPGRPMLSPRMDRPRGQGPRPIPPQGDRKRPLSPPPKSSGKGPGVQSGKIAGPAPPPAAASSKPSNTLSRREELLKQLKAVEDAIARKRAKIPGK
ncbi:zinc finger CCCH domain-containing protein 18 isoform X1 [Phyllopteryx taeniolatus]|uniref:zinc finger CCCH domain-containing protein 18 isoform X1 n=1 Tax=Phyllopteryx taeniolatus TaxID=161469 RepID=UPI002AD55EA8|nr:zinc finger CCCH domain-containing protein 18 isoform X1 [Phyllopteryx taeniolatus]XP_061628777.1 zinc finger CCCH domain-containing protein 18 isoform X1 [Phyllopteryx taeniolatus]